MLAPPPVKLPEDPAQAEASNYTPQELAAKFPASPYAWAELAEAELKAAQSSSDTTAEPAAFITAYASRAPAITAGLTACAATVGRAGARFHLTTSLTKGYCALLPR